MDLPGYGHAREVRTLVTHCICFRGQKRFVLWSQRTSLEAAVRLLMQGVLDVLDHGVISICCGIAPWRPNLQEAPTEFPRSF